MSGEFCVDYFHVLPTLRSEMASLVVWSDAASMEIWDRRG